MENANQVVTEAIKAVFDIDTEVEITRPAAEFGDWATNVALKLAKQLNANPKDIAQKIVDHLNSSKPNWLAEATIAGPGFINIKLGDQPLIDVLNDVINMGDNYGKINDYNGQNMVVEYLDPNILKELHIGHAYTGTIGDAIASLFDCAGATVHRVTYQGDVGLHVAKAMYGILQKIDNDASKLADVVPDDRPRFLSETYVAGAKAYEEDEAAKGAITILNKQVYDKDNQLVNEVYEICKRWSMEYFEDAYQRFDFSPFEKNYMEGAVAQVGLDFVYQHINDGVFSESQGAIIFAGEKYGLHTRVFVNSIGLPTYDAKDLGNAIMKWQDYNYDRSIIITGNDQTEYFRVMLKALEQVAPEQAQRTTHISHGLVKLTTGKMASRTGQVVRALDLLTTTEESAKALAANKDAPVRDVVLAAIKYALLKNRIGGDIIYDIKESLSLEGNSGPYLQYTHARAKSILAKSTNEILLPSDLLPDERVLVVKISEFGEVVKEAIKDLAPHLICTYLYELAQTFNRFYEKNRIIGDAREQQRLSLVKAYATVVKNGLSILRIPAPDHM